MKTQKLLKKIIEELNVEDEKYIEKMELLGKLIQNTGIGFIIEKELVEWCKTVGLKPECQFQNRTSW